MVQSLSMESEDESDAVIISHKPSPAATPSVAASAAKSSSVSFAKIISAAAAGAAEVAPVGVKA